MMMGREYGYGYCSIGYGILPIILIFLFGVVILFLIKKSRRSESSYLKNGSQALSILDERYAKGEITQEEYEKIKKAISHKN